MLRADWRHILARAWSVRFVALAALLSGAEVALAFLDAEILGLPRGAIAAVAAVVSALAIPARLMAQRDFRD